MCGRGPDGTPRVIELDADGYLAGIGILAAHAPQFMGEIWYVRSGEPAGGDGKTPGTPFATMTEAIAAASAGDAISVKSGVYTENVNINLTGLELWGEFGATILGTLTISANSCRVRDMTISPTAAMGVSLSGNGCRLEGLDVIGTPTIAYSINGSLNGLSCCMASGYTITAFDISTFRAHLYRCSARGMDTATRGFYFSNGIADNGFIDSCMSVGNAVAGYEAVAGAINNVFYNCSSGSGDGPRVDTGNASTWPGYTFDNVIHAVTTLDGTGTYNICKITGVVQINHIYGVVETATPAGTTAASLQLFPTGGAAVQLTSLAGSNISSLPAGSMIEKAQAAANAISVSDNTLGFISEQVGLLFAKFAVGQKTGTVTHIRLNVTEAGTSGAIHWYVDWQSLSEDGFIEPV